MDDNQSKIAGDTSAPASPVQPQSGDQQIPVQPSVPVSEQSPVEQSEPSVATPPVQPPAESYPVPDAPSVATNPSETTTSSSATPPLSAKNSSSKKTILIVVLILLVALPVLGWVAYQNMSKNSGTIYQGAYKEKKVRPTTVPIPTVGVIQSGDTKLDQQSTEIDTSMSKLNVDISNIDKELQD